MRLGKVSVIFSVCSFVLLTGCTRQSTTVALKFVPNEITTYKVITETQRSVGFEGRIAKETKSKGGATGVKIEMTFDQQIQNVKDNRNAVAKITIKELSYLSQQKSIANFDFDSLRQEDKDSPMAKLIGKSYTIEISPVGEVVAVVDAGDARKAVSSATGSEGMAGNVAIQKANMMLDDKSIKERHGITALKAAGKKQLRKGDKWQCPQSFSLDMMGTKSYEKIYELKEIQTGDGGTTAIIEMNAIPTSAAGEEESVGFLSGMMDIDNREEFSGLLKIDQATGQILSYSENLSLKWVILDPEKNLKEDQVPNSIIMEFKNIHNIEKIN